MPYLRWVVVVAVLTVTALVAGCTAGTAGEPGSPVGPTGSPAGPPPLPDSTPVPTPSLLAITPAAGLRERLALWRLAGEADGGRRLLLDVAVGGPPCDTVTGLNVVQADTTVTVSVWAGRLTSADCPSGVTGSLATARIEVRLAEPLGGRELTGGDTSQE